MPLLPSQGTMTMMAKGAVAVYEKAVDSPEDVTTQNRRQE
jgi:hypothetical protein